MLEIERKFLVTGDEWRTGPSVLIRQGYLSDAAERTVRVRSAGSGAWLTVKGPTKGATRSEFEYPIDRQDAEELLRLCLQPLIEKYRFKITEGNLVWEIDEFLGANKGLVIAEIELRSERQKFRRPQWLGAEVTYDARFFNSNLRLRPFSKWKKRDKNWLDSSEKNRRF